MFVVPPPPPRASSHHPLPPPTTPCLPPPAAASPSPIPAGRGRLDAVGFVPIRSRPNRCAVGAEGRDRPWVASEQAEEPQFVLGAAGIFFNVCILSNKLLKTSPWLPPASALTLPPPGAGCALGLCCPCPQVREAKCIAPDRLGRVPRMV